MSKTKKLLKSIIGLCLAISILLSMPAGAVFADYRQGATNLQIVGPTDDPVYYYTPPIDEDGNIDYFHYPLYDIDPQDITDEDFFGVWNNSTQSWTTEPYFLYSQYPGLAAVENAAKTGNYELAKEELLNYYKVLLPQRVVTTDTSGNARLLLENFARNIFVNHKDLGNVMRIFTVPYNASSDPDDWEDISVDITDSPGVSNLQEYDEFNVMFSSADKFYTQTEICSKESDYTPVLEVTTSNGGVIECPVIMDFYVRGGSYADTNYGLEDTLKIEEHGGSTELTGGAMDSGGLAYSTDDTYRTMIIFDTSKITTSLNVTSVVMKLRARTNQDRYPKEISLEWHKNTAFVEDEACWNKVPDLLWWSYNDAEYWDFWWNRRTSPIVAKSSQWRGYEANRLASAYKKLDGGTNEAFAYNYLRYEMGLISALGCDYDCMDSLDMSVHVSKQVEGISNVIDSEYMTPTRFVAMVKNMYLMSCVQVYQFFGVADNNWATYSTGSVYNFISRFPEVATHDEWLEKLREENTRVIGGVTFEDGMCIEMPFNYVTTILGTFSDLLSTSIETGHESPLTDEAMEGVYNTVKTLVYAKGPYGAFNQQDDCSTYSPKTSYYKQWYKFGLFDDPGLAYLATEGQEGYMPEHATTHYWDGMKTMFRTGWGVNDTMLSFTNQMSDKASHRHKDALSFSMFAYGKFLLVDPGYGVITSAGWKEYNGSPVQHNLVTVNDIEDFLTTGTNTSYDTIEYGEGSYQLGFESNKIHDFKEYGTTAYTTNKDARRSILFQRDDNFFIVSDYVVPNSTSQNNLYAQHWHFYPGAQFSYDENTFAIQTNIADEPNVKVVPVEYDEVDEVRRVRTSYSELAGSLVNSEKAMVLKTKTGIGRFTTVIVPTDVNEDIEVETTKLSAGYSNTDYVNAAKIRLNNKTTGEDNTYYYFHISDETHKRSSATLDDFVTDASTMLVKLDANGNVVSGFMMNGSYIKNDNINGGYVVKTASKVGSLSFALRDNGVLEMSSTSMDEADVEAMTINSLGATEVTFKTGSWDGVITTVLSEMSLDTKKKGGYFYFGDEPIIDVAESATAATMDYASWDAAVADGWSIGDETNASFGVTGDGNVVMTRTVSVNEGVSSLPGELVYTFGKGVVQEDPMNATAILTNKYKGEVSLDVTYKMLCQDNLELGSSAPYYQMYINGDAEATHLRMKNTSTVPYLSGTGTASDKVNINSDEAVKTITFDINTNTQAVSVAGDYSTQTGTTNETVSYINSISLKMLRRCGVDSYIEFSGMDIRVTPTFTENETAFFATLPANLDSYFANGETRSSVITGFTLPTVDGITWRADGEVAQLEGNEVSVVRSEGRDGVAYVYADFTVDGIDYSKRYSFVVPKSNTQIIFYDKDGNVYSTITFMPGDVVDPISAPQVENQRFIGWFEEGADESFDFTAALTGDDDIKLYPKYVYAIDSSMGYASKEEAIADGWYMSAEDGGSFDVTSDGNVLYTQGGYVAEKVTNWPNVLAYKFGKGVIAEDEDNDTALYTDKYKGKVRVDATYGTNYVMELNDKSPYMHIGVKGDVLAGYVRQTKASAVAYYGVDSVDSQGKVDNMANPSTITYEVDTDNSTIKISGNYDSYSGSIAPVKYIDTFLFQVLYRVENDSTLEIAGLDLSVVPSFTAQETAFMATLPANLDSYFADEDTRDAVTTGFTLPTIDGVTWRGDKKTTTVDGTAVSVSNLSREDKVAYVYADFTVDGIDYTKRYSFVVPKLDIKVVFYDKDGNVYSTVPFIPGDVVDPISAPQVENQRFIGWFEAGATESFDFATAITGLESINLYAKYAYPVDASMGYANRAAATADGWSMADTTGGDFTVTGTGNILYTHSGYTTTNKPSYPNVMQYEFGKGVIDWDADNATKLYTDKYKGKVKVDITYGVNYIVDLNTSTPYAHFGISGDVVAGYVRQHNEAATAYVNSSTDSQGRIGAYNEVDTLTFEVDTDASTLKITGNEGSYTGNINAVKYIDTFFFNMLYRMEDGSTVEVSDLDLSVVPSFTAAETAVLEALPANLDSYFAGEDTRDAVTTAFTLPTVDGVTWRGDGEGTSVNGTTVSVSNNSGVDKEACVYADFTVDGIDYSMEYGFTVSPDAVTPVWTVTFYDKDGEVYSTVEVLDGDSASSISAPQVDHYDFVGWFESGADESYDFSLAVTGDVNLYASYDVTKYNVYFYADGVLVNTIPVAYNTAIGDFLPEIPEVADMTAVEWRIRDTETAFTSSSVVIGETTVDAYYVPTEYTVTFKVDGVEYDSESVVVNNAVTKPTDPTKTGYIFKHWALDGTEYNFTSPVTGDITLDAVFAELKTVTFMSDGAEYDKKSVEVNTKVEKPATNPTKSGYTFKHWALDGTEFDFDTAIVDSITLQAVFAEASGGGGGGGTGGGDSGETTTPTDPPEGYVPTDDYTTPVVLGRVVPGEASLVTSGKYFSYNGLQLSTNSGEYAVWATDDDADNYKGVTKNDFKFYGARSFLTKLPDAGFLDGETSTVVQVKYQVYIPSNLATYDPSTTDTHPNGLVFKMCPGVYDSSTGKYTYEGMGMKLDTTGLATAIRGDLDAKAKATFDAWNTFDFVVDFSPSEWDGVNDKRATCKVYLNGILVGQCNTGFDVTDISTFGFDNHGRFYDPQAEKQYVTFSKGATITTYAPMPQFPELTISNYEFVANGSTWNIKVNYENTTAADISGKLLVSSNDAIGLTSSAYCYDVALPTTTAPSAVTVTTNIPTSATRLRVFTVKGLDSLIPLGISN